MDTSTKTTTTKPVPVRIITMSNIATSETPSIDITPSSDVPSTSNISMPGTPLLARIGHTVSPLKMIFMSLDTLRKGDIIDVISRGSPTATILMNIPINSGGAETLTQLPCFPSENTRCTTRSPCEPLPTDLRGTF